MGMVFNIQRYSVQDGPGIRTTVFVKGCPLRCLWCSNPESQLAYPEIAHRNSLCNRCGRCLDVCEPGAILLSDEGIRIDRRKCTGCTKCVVACMPGAIEVLGKELSVADVLAEVERDALFYRNSGGGVTVSGGEPLTQPEFVRSLLATCQHEGFHTTIDTCGYADPGSLESVLPYAELVLFDIKHMHSGAHRDATGVGNETILENARLIAARGVPILVRIPTIPGINDSAANVAATARFVAGLGDAHRLELLLYHRYGSAKYENLDREYPLGALQSPPAEQMEDLKRIVESRGVPCDIGG